jgi:HlyD family secretion protein
MNRKLRKLVLTLVPLLLAAGAIWYGSLPEPVAVNAATVERGLVESTVANTRAGTVKTCRRARIAPLSGGQVERLLVEKGQQVEKGQALLELWNRDLEAKLQLAQSEAAASEAQRVQACLKADIAEREHQRTLRLFKQKLIAEEQRDKAETEAKSSLAACRAAGAKEQVSRDQVSLARTNLERTILKAPFSGVVAEINGEPGEIVTPSPIGIATPPAVDLIDPDCLYAAAPIDEVDAPAVELCMPARITLDAFPQQAFSGKVQNIAPYVLDVEKQARTVEVEVFFDRPEEVERLLPGYSADVEIILDKHEDVLRIPSEAVLEGNRVLVVNTEQRLEERRIETGLRNWQYTEVTAGLAAGEQLVLSINREGVEAGALVSIEESGNGR